MGDSDLVGQHFFEGVAGLDRIDGIDRQIERAAVGGQFQPSDTGSCGDLVGLGSHRIDDVGAFDCVLADWHDLGASTDHGRLFR
jgi:hypothetical protein